jgi:hypothetical protein
MSDRIQRRAFLGVAAGGLAATLAGVQAACGLGNGNGRKPPKTTTTTSTTTTTPTTTTTTTTTLPPTTTSTTSTTSTTTTIPPVGGSIFITDAELNSKPISGTGWNFLKAKADATPGVVDLADQSSLTQSNLLAAALVFARTGNSLYRDKVISFVKQAPGTELNGPDHLLGVARTLYGYVVSADLVQMPLSTVCNNGQTWEQFLSGIRAKEIPGHGRWKTLDFCSANTSCNWGAYALSSHLAVSYALNDSTAVQRDLDIFKRFLGDTSSPAAPFVPTAGYNYNNNGVTWDMTPTLQRGINPDAADPRVVGITRCRAARSSQRP